MKKLLSLWFTMGLVFTVLCSMPVTVNAMSRASQDDGLEVNIVTDKEKYSAGEDINVSIGNTNLYSM